MCLPTTASVTVVQAIDISCPVGKASDFLHDAPQWLPWALPGVESVRPLPFGQWLVKLSHSLVKLRPVYNAARVLTSYELLDPTVGAWQVPVQMRPTPTGCHLAVTFAQLAHFDRTQFQLGLVHVAAGLDLLKLVLEQD